MEEKVKIGISSCLLGNAVRWNAGHKLDRYLTDTLGRFVEYVPVCPEAEAGFGVPRESFRLVGDSVNPRLITYKSKTDCTDRMVRWTERRVKELLLGKVITPPRGRPFFALKNKPGEVFTRACHLT